MGDFVEDLYRLVEKALGQNIQYPSARAGNARVRRAMRGPTAGKTRSGLDEAAVPQPGVRAGWYRRLPTALPASSPR
jgi:hypothetical protein